MSSSPAAQPLRHSEVLSSAPTSIASERTLGDLLSEVAASRPDAPTLAVAGSDERWDAQALLADATLIAGGLLQQGRPGMRVATCLSNGPAAVVLQFAIALAGMTLVPVNPRSSSGELDHALLLSNAELLFTCPEGPSVDPAAHVRTVTVEANRWRTNLPTAEVELPHVEADSPAQVQFTSGTTGRPKGVMITHGGMLATARAFADALGPRAGAVWLNPMPLFHTAGNVLGTVAALAAGAEHVVLPFEAGAVLQALGMHRVTLLSAAPTLLDLLLAHEDWARADLSTLQVVFTGGMTVTPEFTDRVESGFGARLAVTFGMTETCGSALLSAPDDPDDARRNGRGAPLPGTDVRIVDTDGRVVPVDSPGELLLRGTRLTPGYLDDPAATAAAIDADRWLHTGDRAEMDADGRCVIVGRIKDMIKTGGENVSPVEVEEVICTHPAVDVAAVVGAPDARWGELVVAFVVPRDRGVAADELTEWCRARLSPFKVPRRWFLIDALPMTASAKIRRAELRERAVRESADSEL